MLLVTRRCCSPAWPPLNEKRTGKKKSHIKEGGASEHTHRLRNRHGPMVAQRCLGAKTNSPRKFALVSCFELPKLTSFRPDFVRNYVISQLVLRSRLKYIGAFIFDFWPNLVSVSSKRIAKRMLLAQIKANYSSGADSSSDDENADKEDGDSPKKGKDGAKKQDESGERWFRQGWAISYLFFFFFLFWLNCSRSQSVSTDRASHFKLC